MAPFTKIYFIIGIVLKKDIQFDLQHLYLSRKSYGSGIFLIELYLCIDDVSDSKDDVHYWFCLHPLFCLPKYIQFDI